MIFHVICRKSLLRGPVFLIDGRKEETQICSVFRLMCPEQGLGFWSSLPAGLRHSCGLGLRIIGTGELKGAIETGDWSISPDLF